MTPVEVALGGSVMAGAVVVYLGSDRELTDKLYAADLGAAVVGGGVHSLSGESWALAFALGFVVTLAYLDRALDEVV